MAELPLTTQARLLRVLESGEYLRVGSSEVMKTDIRVVAATNKDMRQAIKEGKFREDLFYRLSTVQINIPPLRERGNDILLLVRKFVTDFADRYRTPAVAFSDDAKQALLNYRWPGNVRQLKNVIEQMALFEAGKTLQRDDIVNYLPDMGASYKPVVIDKAQFDYTQERELLFKMLFSLQSELEHLKSIVEKSQATGRTVALDVDDNDADITTHAPSNVAHHHAPVSFGHLAHNDHENNGAAPHDEHDIHDLQATDFELVDDGRTSQHADNNGHNSRQTLEDLERETIQRALERNAGRRKNSAAELGISERTLYRKIKEYNLDN